MKSLRILTAVAMASLGTAFQTVAAQANQSANDLIRSFRATDGRTNLGRILAHRDASFSPHDLDVIADSLVSMALSEDTLLSHRAIAALAFAARPALPLPYAGSLVRLRSIVLQAQDPLVKVSAFGGFLDAPGSEAEFELIQRFVTAPGTAGALAFAELERRGRVSSIVYRPPVRSVLRRVIEAGRFQSPEAQTLAEAVARENGWTVGGASPL